MYLHFCFLTFDTSKTKRKEIQESLRFTPSLLSVSYYIYLNLKFRQRLYLLKIDKKRIKIKITGPGFDSKIVDFDIV